MNYFKNIAALVTLVTMLVSCSNETEKAAPEEVKEELSLTDQQLKFNNMTFSTLEEKEFSPIISAYGKVEVPPQNKSVITAKYGGFIKRINILEGQRVKKGEVLIELEDPSILQMQQDFLENESTLEYLKSEYDRQKLLSDQEATSMKIFQQAKSNYMVAKAKQTGLKSKLTLAGVNTNRINENAIQATLSLKAPFDGIVTKVNVQTGTYVQSQDQLLELIDTEHAHAELFVYENDVHLLKEGQQINMTFSNRKESVLGKVYLIGYDISNDKTVKVHGHFDKEHSDILPGAFFNAKIKAVSKSYLALPLHAVINNKGKNIIFLATSKKGSTNYFKAIEVKVVAQNDEFAAINFENMAQLKHANFIADGAYELFSKMVGE